MKDTIWGREVAGRLAAQYPRVGRTDVEHVVALWTRLLTPTVAPADLPRVVEESVREALHGALVPRQRRQVDVRARL